MFTNTFYPHVGGVANSVAIFSEDLRKMGHKVLIIAPKFKGLDESQENSNEILRVPAIQNFNGSDFSVRLALPFLIDEKIDEFQPEIIHSNHPFLLGDAALRAAYRRNLPIVFTHHTRYEDYTHYVPLDSDLLKKYVINLATQYANYCSAVIAPSASIADLIVKRGVTKPVRTLPTGVDTKFYAQGNGQKIRKAFNLTEKNPIIGHVGRLAPEKNLNFLAKSTACFIENNPSAVFLIAGSGPSEEAIKKIFAAKGLDSKLIFAGTLKGQNLSDFYNAIDIFAFASKSETQGMVLTEAMAAGKPVVALTAPGVRDVLRNGENGLLLAQKISNPPLIGANRP
jgi:glycosyltransferase involved in cell wall biosynthesis